MSTRNTLLYLWSDVEHGHTLHDQAVSLRTSLRERGNAGYADAQRPRGIHTAARMVATSSSEQGVRRAGPWSMAKPHPSVCIIVFNKK